MLDGDGWAQRDGGDGPADDLPGPRVGAAMTYDPRRGTVVLAGSANGGYYSLEWDGQTWTPLEVAGEPADRANLAMAYDDATASIVVFGGGTSPYPGETYTLTWQGGASERCLQGLDDDADGRAGCDDDDCWWMCTPSCAPLTAAAGLCPAPAGAACGDGTCSAGETCARCPADCGTCDVCGDGVCDPSERNVCVVDCPPVCGDGICDPGEGYWTCEPECPV
ncbi:MAG: hypothetical protein R2939_19060 [Kofleriaceae bacterium]